MSRLWSRRGQNGEVPARGFADFIYRLSVPRTLTFHEQRQTEANPSERPYLYLFTRHAGQDRILYWH